MIKELFILEKLSLLVFLLVEKKEKSLSMVSNDIFKIDCLLYHINRVGVLIKLSSEIFGFRVELKDG